MFHTPPAPSHAPPLPRWRRLAREASTLATFLFVALAARSSLADHYVIPSGSMEPTLGIGDRVLVNKAAYGLRIPFTRVVLTGAAVPARGASWRGPETRFRSARAPSS